MARLLAARHCALPYFAPSACSAVEEVAEVGGFPPFSRWTSRFSIAWYLPSSMIWSGGRPLAQIIVAHELTQCGNDQGQLVPLIEAIENNLGRKPEQASADSGYCSDANLEALEAHGIDGYVAPGRAKHPTAANGKIGGPLTQRMRQKIDDGGFETPYRLRKQVVEPVFGQIKQARAFRQFLLRGVEKVRAEWAMICTAHNLQKLFTLTKAA